MTKIKVATFSQYGLLDLKDFYRKVLDHLKKHNLGFCFLEDGSLISKEQCEEFIK